MNPHAQIQQPRAAFSICSGAWGPITVASVFHWRFFFPGSGFTLFFFCFFVGCMTSFEPFFSFLIISLFPFTFSPVAVQEALPQQKFLLSLLFVYDGWVIKGINAQRITPPAPHGPCDSTPGGPRVLPFAARHASSASASESKGEGRSAFASHTHRSEKKGRTRGGWKGFESGRRATQNWGRRNGNLWLLKCSESIINLSSLSLPTVDLMITGGTSISGVINVYIFFPPSFHERLQCQVQLILTGSHVLMSFSLSLFYFPVLFIA